MVKLIGVVGSGTMGGAIAYQAAMCGFEVVLNDLTDEVLKKAVKRMEKFMDRSIEKGKMDFAEKDIVLSRIKRTTKLEDLKECDVIIEAIIEDLKAKKEMFARLDEIVKEEAIIASNTSSMSITTLASVTKRPSQVAGMHFFNPPQIMKLVEVIRGYE